MVNEARSEDNHKRKNKIAKENSRYLLPLLNLFCDNFGQLKNKK